MTLNSTNILLQHIGVLIAASSSAPKLSTAVGKEWIYYCLLGIYEYKLSIKILVNNNNKKKYIFGIRIPILFHSLLKE